MAWATGGHGSPLRWPRHDTGGMGYVDAIEAHCACVLGGGFDRSLIFGADSRVYEAPEPVWDEGRVVRAR